MGSQMGKTEILLNVLGHRMQDGPFGPVLYIAPTEKLARSMSNDRVDKLLRSVPELWERTEKGQRYGTTEKWVSGQRLGFAWAGSPTELASHPVRLVLTDERDRMDADVKGEGDPYEIADARLSNYTNGLHLVASTPTLEGASPTWSLFESGTMCMWAYPCRHCGEWFVPRLRLLQWADGAGPAEAQRSARLACPHCGGLHEPRERARLNSEGKFIAHRKPESDGAEYIALSEWPENTTASFWVSGLARFKRDWGDLAARYVRAAHSKSQQRLQAVVNTQFGELYRIRGDAPDWQLVANLREGYAPWTLPEGVQLITAGVDVQKAGFWFVVRGWGHNLESWGLAHGFIAGETEFDGVWLLLRQQLARTFEGVPIARTLIDSGYKPGDTFKRPEHQVYVWCRRQFGRWLPSKGKDQAARPWWISKIDPTIDGQKLVGGLDLVWIDTDYVKTWIHDRIRWPEGEAGGFHLHAETDDDYCKQLVSEELIVTPSGARKWRRTRIANHLLDAEGNAFAAALTLSVHRLPLWEDSELHNHRQGDAGGQASSDAAPVERPGLQPLGGHRGRDSFARR